MYQSQIATPIQSEPPQAASAVKVFLATNVSSQKKWAPMVGRNPVFKENVGKIPPRWLGPKAKKS